MKPNNEELFDPPGYEIPDSNLIQDLGYPLRTAYEPRGGGGVSPIMTQMITEEAPCENCLQRQQCKDFSLACADFKYYVTIGTNRRRRRAPTRKIFNQLFIEVEDD